MTPLFARGRRVALRAGHAAILVFFVTFLAFPFYWMAITTFKTTQDLHNTENNPYLFNNPPTLRHLSVLFEDTQYLQWLVNTGFVGVLVVLITLLLAVPAGYALARMTGLIDRLVVYPERMRANLESSGGLADSQRVLLALTQAGMSREDAYAAVQRHAMAAWRGDGRFADSLKQDREIGRYLDPQTIDGLFDTAYHLKHVDTIFRRVFDQQG